MRVLGLIDEVLTPAVTAIVLELVKVGVLGPIDEGLSYAVISLIYSWYRLPVRYCIRYQ